MVCDRCIMLVTQRLKDLSIRYDKVQLGEINLNEPLSKQQEDALKEELKTLGFELVEDRKTSIVTRIKSSIIKYIHGDADERAGNKKISVLLSETLGADYSSLSALFSATEGITIEKYVILQRIEKVKELLEYNEHSLSQIADLLSYSSVQHLSQQFRKVTGLTPSTYKQAKNSGRQPLDQVGTEII